MNEISESHTLLNKTHNHERALSLLKNSKLNFFTSDYLVGLLSRDSLIKIQEFMRKNKSLKITQFFRFFRQLLPFPKNQSEGEQQFFIHYALFKLFTQICNSKKRTQITFSDISSHIAQKMPNFTQQSIIQQKLLPLGLNIDQSHKAHISPPEVYGQVLQDRCFITPRPIKSDRIQHLSREVGQSEYSKKFKNYFSIDKPSIQINVFDDNFNIVNTLKTEQEMTKRDMIVNCIAWSDREQKIACILGNYSISMWSKQDNYKYQVNIPLPSQHLANPYIIIKYMDSMRKWIAIDNRPAIHVLSNINYQPQYTFINAKIKKKKQSQKIYLVQLSYVQLLCIGFQRNLFLVSLKNKQIVSQLTNMRTGITSITFSESYQALFVSTYEMYFRSFELSEYQDLMERGKFQGHKSQISLLGIIESKPIVFSLQENSILKMFDMRDYICYQSISVLKNVIYKQVLYLQDAVCFVGSKMHVYGIQKQMAYKEKQTVIYIQSFHKDLLVVTNKNLRIYDIRNGALKSVIKALFNNNEASSDVYSAFIMHNKQKLMIQSQQGQCIVMQTKQMSEIQSWKLQPKPKYMHFDEQNDLLTQVSLGSININLFHNDYCQKQLRRQIINHQDSIRNIKISTKHDIIMLCYQGDECLYFYAYQKGKLIGYLYFGEKRTIKFMNAYRPHKIIHKIVDFQFYQNKNVLVILLCDQLMVLTYKRSMSSMSFFIKKSIKLWQSPLKLIDNTQVIYDQKKLEQPLHSTSLSIFQGILAITSNKCFIVSAVSFDINRLSGVSEEKINKENYNPSRTGSQQHTNVGNIINPLFTIIDYCTSSFTLNYYVYKNKLGQFVTKSKLGNLLVVADDKLNVIIYQNLIWNNIAGIINCQATLPKLWNIFKYSESEIKQVQFVLDFLDNQQYMPEFSNSKILMQKSIQPKQIANQFIKITISQLLQEDKQKDGFKTYRSCSLRQKKIVLQKQRDEREKLQNFLQQQRKQKKQKPNNSVKNLAQKQINDTLGYLSVNHNQVIMKMGMVQQDYPSVRVLQKKLLSSVNKDEKKSLISYKTAQQSNKTNKIRDIIANFSMKQSKIFAKTPSTQIYEGLKQKAGIQKLNSKQLIQKLNMQRTYSQRSIKSLPKQFLPKIRN